MFEQLKSVFSHSKHEPDFPASVWALTVLLNPDTSKKMTPHEAVDFAERHKDDVAEQTLPLYFGGTENAKTVDLFTAEEDACDYIGILCDWRTMSDEEIDTHRATFGLVLLRRELLYGVLVPIQNVRVTLDLGLPAEREVTLTELHRYIKEY